MFFQLGSLIIDSTRSVSQFVQLVLQTLSSAITPPYRIRDTIRQLYFVANESVIIVCFCVASAAMVTIIESSFHMKMVIQNDSMVPGFAAALILLALGVPRAVVMQDYLLTNELFRMPRSTPGLVSQEVLDVLWRVQEDFLDAALHALEADFGGVQPYLQQALGLGRTEQERLVALYLQA